MKKINLAGVIILLTIISSCSKTATSPANVISGTTWVFNSQNNQSFSYPSVLTNPYPISVSNWTYSLDSIKISFDDNGNYSFINLHLPVDGGTYAIVYDSLLVIKPDTSGFIKFCYSNLTFTAGSGMPQSPPSPYADFKFTSDTILFKITNANNIVFTTFWMTKTDRPIGPGQDTLMIIKRTSYFKKQ